MRRAARGVQKILWLEQGVLEPSLGQHTEDECTDYPACLHALRAGLPVFERQKQDHPGIYQSSG